MRFKLLLDVNKKAFGNVLPINYQYEQSAVIYRILSSAEIEYANCLHENGYTLENGKQFKLFTFSRLKIFKREIIPEEGTRHRKIYTSKRHFYDSIIVNNITFIISIRHNILVLL